MARVGDKPLSPLCEGVVVRREIDGRRGRGFVTPPPLPPPPSPHRSGNTRSGVVWRMTSSSGRPGVACWARGWQRRSRSTGVSFSASLLVPFPRVSRSSLAHAGEVTRREGEAVATAGSHDGDNARRALWGGEGTRGQALRRPRAGEQARGGWPRASAAEALRGQKVSPLTVGCTLGWPPTPWRSPGVGVGYCLGSGQRGGWRRRVLPCRPMPRSDPPRG